VFSSLAAAIVVVEISFITLEMQVGELVQDFALKTHRCVLMGGVVVELCH